MILRLFNMADSIWTNEGIYEMLDRYANGGYAVFNTFSWFSNIINLALAVLSVIGMWKMFTKAGENDWGAIIPFYNKYLLFKISDMKNWYWAYLVLTLFYGVGICAFFVFLIASFFSTIGNQASSDWVIGTTASIAIVVAVLAVLVFVLNIVRSIKLARNFHLSGWWVLGFLLLPGVFYMIVGCSGKIRFKERLVSGLLPGQIPQGPPTAGPQGYGQQTYDPYRSQNVYGQGNVYGNQGNVYGAQNNPYGAPNPYAGNPYAQNANPYAVPPQNVSPAPQAQYGQNVAPGAPQDPYAANKGGRDEALWKTIYDDDANNIK